LVAAGVILSQCLVGRLFFRDAGSYLPSKWQRPARSALYGIWAVTLCGLVMDLLAMRYRGSHLPSFIRVASVCVEILWSFGSGLAALIWMFWRSRLAPHSQSRRTALRTAAACTVAAPFAVVGFGALVERSRFEVSEVEFPVPGLHPDLEGLRIAQISDLHVSPFLSIREAARVIDITNELRPHLTVMTGDLISEFGDPLDAVIYQLGRLRAEAGVLGCLGNHEMYAECENYTAREAARRGVTFLRGEARQLKWGQGVLNVAGVDFQRFSNRANYLPGSERLVRPGTSNLLLSHNPDVFPVAVRKGFDAVLAGHTHGGQVTMEIVSRTVNLARFFTPYVRGLYRLDGNSCYVNNGIGTISMPVRLGAPPEITLLRLRRA